MKKSLFYRYLLVNQSIALTFILVVVWSVTAQAEQLHFSKIKQTDGYQFNYQWRDHQNSPQSISFLLSKEVLFDRFRNFRAYKAEFAEKAIFQAIKKEWKKSPIEGIQIKFPQSKSEKNIKISGHNQDNVNKAYQKLAQLEQQCTNNYLAENFYQKFTTHDQITAIKPNHVKIANASVVDLRIIKPLILEKVSIKNIRKVTDYVLSFVQSIPYSTLESRVTSSGAGFNTPLKVIWENQGDCDSKVTLTAAMLRGLMPRIAMILVFVDQHAFIGIAIPPEVGEITIVENDVTYVLAEPTGPALISLGHLSASSEQAIYNGHYITEKY